MKKYNIISLVGVGCALLAAASVDAERLNFPATEAVVLQF